MTDQRIDVARLRSRLDAFLADLELRHPSVRVPDDAFWSVPLDDAFDVHAQPSTLTNGLVSDAWHQVDRDEGHIDYEAVAFADILRAIAYELHRPHHRGASSAP